MPGDEAALHGRHILVVEDEVIVAMNLERLLEEFGCIVIGPVATVRDALTLAESRRLDGALLDVNVRGERVFPVADALVARGIPTIFVTGYGADVIPRHLEAVPVLSKPYEAATLKAVMARALGGPP